MSTLQHLCKINFVEYSICNVNHFRLSTLFWSIFLQFCHLSLYFSQKVHFRYSLVWPITQNLHKSWCHRQYRFFLGCPSHSSLHTWRAWNLYFISGATLPRMQILPPSQQDTPLWIFLNLKCLFICFSTENVENGT